VLFAIILVTKKTKIVANDTFNHLGQVAIWAFSTSIVGANMILTMLLCDVIYIRSLANIFFLWAKQHFKGIVLSLVMM